VSSVTDRMTSGGDRNTSGPGNTSDRMSNSAPGV
jgi:hypothetical protein